MYFPYYPKNLKFMRKILLQFPFQLVNVRFIREIRDFFSNPKLFYNNKTYYFVTPSTKVCQTSKLHPLCLLVLKIKNNVNKVFKHNLNGIYKSGLLVILRWKLITVLINPFGTNGTSKLPTSNSCYLSFQLFIYW